MSKRVAISLTALFAVVALAFVGWVELSYRAARASGYGVTRSAIGRSPFGALLGCSAADDFARICGFAAEVNANPTHEEARLEAAIARLQATMCNRGMVTIFSAVATVSVKDKLRLLREGAREVGADEASLACPALQQLWPATDPPR